MGKNVSERHLEVVTFRLEQRQIDFLDGLARKTGAARSEIARQIFDNVQLINRPVLGSKIDEEKIREQVLGQ